MLFQSFKFVIFFAKLFLVFLVLRRFKFKFLTPVLLIASYYFYASWNKYYLILIIISTILDYFISNNIFRTTSLIKKKSLLITSICLNLGLLGTFKYYNFLMESIEFLIGTLGYNDFSIERSTLILPVGISFYTFQTMSYTIDVYRGNIKPAKNILDFATFVSFFPQLVAGPIIRAKDFFPYLEKPIFNLKQIYFGIGLFTIGLLKKIVIADMLAMTFVDEMFKHMEYFSFLDIVLGTVGYAFQIYNDFSGYTDMAIGLALILGFDFPENFNYPYSAINIRDFWKRWHISLSTWLRDYLYIPLGGNKGSNLYKCRNIFITMLLGGLWHGASWNFVLWGAFHGFIITVSHFINDYLKIDFLKFKIVKRIATFGLVAIGWFVFRIESIDQIAIAMNKFLELSDDFTVNVANRTFYTYMIIAIAQQFLSSGKNKNRAIKFFVNSNSLVKAIYIIFIVAIMIGYKFSSYSPFIYFQF